MHLTAAGVQARFKVDKSHIRVGFLIHPPKGDLGIARSGENKETTPNITGSGPKAAYTKIGRKIIEKDGDATEKTVKEGRTEGENVETDREWKK